MLWLCCLIFKTRLRNQVWSTSLRGTNANRARNAASSDYQLPRTSAVKSWYRNNALSCKCVRNITRVTVCFLASSVYVWPSIAKRSVSINSAGSCCPLSSLTSRPWKQGTRSCKEELMTVRLKVVEWKWGGVGVLVGKPSRTTWKWGEWVV